MGIEVALFSELPPVRSGVAEYTHVLARELSRRGYRVTVYTETPVSTSPAEYSISHGRSLRYQGLPPHAVPLYQIGNFPAARKILPFVLTYPGILTLHDLFIGYNRLRDYGRVFMKDEWADEFDTVLGKPLGNRLTWLIERGVGLAYIPRFLPLYESLLRASFRVIAHNPDAARELRGTPWGTRVRFIPMGLWNSPQTRRPGVERIRNWRRSLNLPEGALVFGMFGILSRYKRVPSVFAVIKALRDSGTPAYLLCMGHAGDGPDVRTLAVQYGVQEYVRVCLNASREAYILGLFACDVGLSLRFPPMGECSLSTLEMMAAGLPVIMLQHRYNAHFPPGTCIRIPPTRELPELVQAARFLAACPSSRREVGIKAARYAINHHRLETMIEGYAGLIEEFHTRPDSHRLRSFRSPRHLRPLGERAYETWRAREAVPLPCRDFTRRARAILHRTEPYGRRPVERGSS